MTHSRGRVRPVFLFSLPIIISQACDSLMMFTDRYLLSQMDPVSPTASMTGGMTAFLLWIFGAGLLGFTNPLVAQFVGSKNEAKARSVVPHSLMLALALAIPLFLFGNTLGTYYFSFLKIPDLEYPLATQYFSIMLNACIFVFAKVVFAGFFSGIGKTRIVMCVNILGLILNIPLSYYFIHGGIGEHWSGIRGAALGTVCAEVFMTLVYALAYLHLVLSNGKVKVDFDPSILKKLLRFGAPTGLEFFILTFAFNSFLTMFHSFGIDAAQGRMNIRIHCI